MENRRTRTRFQDEQELLRRYREMKKERETASGSKGGSESSDIGFLDSSSDTFNVKLGLSGSKSVKFGDSEKRVIRNSDGVIFSGENNSKSGKSKNVDKNKKRVMRNSNDFVKFDDDGASIDKNKFKSAKIEKNKRGVKRGSDGFIDPGGYNRRKGNFSEAIRKNRNVDRVIVGDNVREDSLDVIELKDNDSEEEDQFTSPDGSIQFGVSDEKSKEGSFGKGVVNSKEIKGLSKKDERNKDLIEVSDDTDDGIQVIGDSMVNSSCSSSGKEPCTEYNKDELASPSEKRIKIGTSKDTNEEFFRVSNPDEKQTSEELSKNENTSSSDAYSSDSLYVEEEKSSSSDEVVFSDDDKDGELVDSFVVSKGPNRIGKDKKMDEKEKAKESKSKKTTIEFGGQNGLEYTSVAERIRLRRSMKSNRLAKSKTNNDVMGTFSSPCALVSDDELDSLQEEENLSHEYHTASREEDILIDTEKETKGKRKAVHEVINKGKDLRIDSENEINFKRKRGRPAKSILRSSKSVNKILVASIWANGDAQLEKFASPEENQADGVETLPNRFWFSDSDEEISETPDVEVENLFEQMDYCMKLLDIGLSDSDMVDLEENIVSNPSKDPAFRCLGGGCHHLILDEQIGLRCTVCYLVITEIRHILPEFSKRQCGRAEARDFEGGNYSNFNAFHIDEFTTTEVTDFSRRVQSKGTVWDLVPGIKDGMYQHQQEGFEFIWKNIAGSILIEKAKMCISDGGGRGCIISHAPGTGKTRLTIMFLQTYMQLNPNCRPVIIAPCSMLLTWEDEFRKWNVGIPFHNLNSLDYSGQEIEAAVNFAKDRRDLDTTRLVKLMSWVKTKSVLGISYQLFEELANISVLIDRVEKGKCKDKVIAGEIRKMLLEFPGLLVLDEGHIPRNHKSQIWKTLTEVETERRIMLSGTPFQNNFTELLNTFSIVRPTFSNDIFCQAATNGKEKHRKIRKAVKGKWASMTNNIGKDDNHKVEELKKIISNFVHVYKGAVLKEKLPGLRDFVVVLSPTKLQRDLMEVVENKDVTFFKKENLLSMISVHPALVSFNDLSEKETPFVTPFVSRDELERLIPNPNAGVKTRFLTELIKFSWALNERVLVFSQYIKPLKFIMKQLEKHFRWSVGQEILYMGGEHCEKERQSSINKLNDPGSEVRVLLASSRACSEGINLVGASRVVLLDVVWNPSMTKQSISRAYRLGQKKVVHVYQLIAGTREWKKYANQAGKDRISDLVFSSKDGASKPESSCSVSEDKILHDMVQHESMKNIFLKILNQPKESDLIDANWC